MSVRAPLLPARVRWTAVLSLAAFVFYASIVTVPPETAVDAGKPGMVPLDKWRHVVAYAALGYALAYATTERELDSRRLAGLVVGTAVLYGVGIEFGQALTPHRHFSIVDAYANALGGALVVPWYALRPHVEFVPIRSFLHELAARR